MTLATSITRLRPPNHNTGRPAARSFGLVSIALALAGCSFTTGQSAEEVAQELIENDLATELGLEGLTATCEEPADQEVGTTFTCTSTSDLGAIEWLATMADEDTVNVESVNLLTPADLETFEAEAVRVLEEQVGVVLGTENFDCGDQPVVLGDDLTVGCALTAPDDASLVYDATITITDLEGGTFDVVVADTPRP